MAKIEFLARKELKSPTLYHYTHILYIYKIEGAARLWQELVAPKIACLISKWLWRYMEGVKFTHVFGG